MSPFLFTTFRLLLIPVAVWTGVVIYGYSVKFFGTVIPIPEERSLIYGALLAQSFLAAALVSGIFSYPIAYIYRKYAVGVALVMSIPVLVMQLPSLFDFSRNPYATFIHGYEVFAYFGLLVGGVWVTHNHLAHSNPPLNMDAPPGDDAPVS